MPELGPSGVNFTDLDVPMLEQEAPATQGLESVEVPQNTETADQTSVPPAQEQPVDGGNLPAQIDWDSDDNPYKSRFKGMQGTYQQLLERTRETEARQNALEDQHYEAQINALPPEQQPIARQQYEYFKQNRQREQELAQAQRAYQQGDAENQRIAKIFAANHMAQQYGVKAADLMAFDNPVAMEQAAKLAAANREASQRSAARQQRSTDGNDRFDAAQSTPSTKKEKTKDLRQAARNFAALPEPR